MREPKPREEGRRAARDAHVRVVYHARRRQVAAAAASPIFKWHRVDVAMLRARVYSAAWWCRRSVGDEGLGREQFLFDGQIFVYITGVRWDCVISFRCMIHIREHEALPKRRKQKLCC